MLLWLPFDVTFISWSFVDINDFREIVVRIRQYEIETRVTSIASLTHHGCVRHMRQQTRPSLVQIMAYRPFGAKPLSELMLAHCKLNPQAQISVKVESKHDTFYTIWTLKIIQIELDTEIVSIMPDSIAYCFIRFYIIFPVRISDLGKFQPFKALCCINPNPRGRSIPSELPLSLMVPIPVSHFY